jgi:hypothetical protein
MDEDLVDAPINDELLDLDEALSKLAQADRKPRSLSNCVCSPE